MPSGDIFNPDEIDLPSGCFIGGEFVPGEGNVFEVIRPSDGRLAKVERSASPALVDRAVQAAAKAHAAGAWAKSPPRERARIMRRWAELIIEHEEELARLEAVVSTRIVTEARERDVRLVAEVIRYYGELTDKVTGEVLPTASDVLGLTTLEPYGVVAAISPWNVPLLLATLKVAPALAAGNAVVLKPSEMTPYSILRLAQLGHDAGIPAGQFGVVLGLGPDTGAALVKHPLVNYVTFTGSVTTGARVMADAALSGIKPVSLELGGKSPQLVFGDTDDIDRVAQTVARAVTRNAGQICFAGTRLVVEKKIAETLVAKVEQIVSELAPGPTWNGATSLAPIISAKQADRIENILKRSIAAGAEIQLGGKRLDAGNGGAYFQPTIVTDAAPDNPIILEEVFGPVLAVQTFNDFEEGIALADHPAYGLAGGVHTADINKALRAAQSIQAGTIWVNDYGPTPDVVTPFGGYKQSGFGKDFGVQGLLKFLHSKTIWIRKH